MVKGNVSGSLKKGQGGGEGQYVIAPSVININRFRLDFHLSLLIPLGK